MRYRNMIIASGLTAAALAVVAGIASGRLPAGTRLPTHWGPDGLPDRFADANTALFMPVALTLVVSLFMAALPSIEPLQDKLSQSAPLYRTAWGGLLGLMVLVEAMAATPAFGIALPPTTMLAGFGAFLIALGNVLPKSRPGFFIGIRTPWTLTDPDNWIATHRLGAKTMMAAGIALIAAALLPLTPGERAPVMIAWIGFAVIPPVAYSFLYWRRHQRSA